MFQDNQQISEELMDSGDLEKERGITILLAKPASLWSGYRLNIIDTPGHADFGGEVEQVLHMADGVMCWLMMLPEGPMPQTKFVLGKALAQVRPIVIINKVDKPDAVPRLWLMKCLTCLWRLMQ